MTTNRKGKAMGDYYDIGYRDGRNSARWVTDGNTTTETFLSIYKGWENGNPETMDLQPNPLSGEWAGESIPEIFGHHPEDVNLFDYEDGFSDGFWLELLDTCRVHLQHANLL
jgi:hypothetical protein